MKQNKKSLTFLIISLLILIAVIFLPKNSSFDKNELETTVPENDTSEESINTSDSDKELFYVESVSDEMKAYMTGKSFTENDNISFDELRHVVVHYIDFTGRKQYGELIVNKEAADDVAAIFKELYDNLYPIEKIKLIDEYNGDDNASMADNNTSCFNYRMIEGTNVLSDHALGLAIDINPLYNPNIKTIPEGIEVSPQNASGYADRNMDFPHKITHDDLCYTVFTKYGWQWGGDWDSPIDYQHFYKPLN